MEDNFTKEEKKKVCEAFGYKAQRGFVLPYSSPENSENIFIDEKEIDEHIKSIKEYYWHEGSELMIEVDDLFTWVIDEIYDEDDLDNEINELNLEGHIREKYLS